MSLITYGWRFIFFLLVQVFILNQLEVGWGIQAMPYPLFILLLPVEMSVLLLMIISFVLGLGIDALSNTYGLHASSLLAFAYFRPMIFKLFAPRDGYDPLIEPNMFTMGNAWFIKTFGLLLVIHHLWFFSLEMFKWNEILLILQKTILSFVVSFIICVLIHFILINRPKES